jgi:UDP-N-acetylmuramate: L-alanyl-gamma-D-glutamyl-meso-diaminopimelate ligase
MRIHLIAIGGALMHSLAIALQQNGHIVTGSDDEIYEPASSNLVKNNLLPIKEGWFEERINPTLDLVILGMHAQKDNIELLKAQYLGLKIVSYPEFLYQFSKNKIRIVVAGSHGKTSTTAAIMHILHHCGVNFDYAVGAKLANFDNMVRLSDAAIIVIEGDEYFSSAIDMRAKMLYYKPNIAILTGISWDHINVFPTFGLYLDTFQQFVDSMNNLGDCLFYYQHDAEIKTILSKKTSKNLTIQPYQGFNYYINSVYQTVIYLANTKNEDKNQQIKLKVFGNHNLENLSAAVAVSTKLGLDIDKIYACLATFEGASKRLEKIYTTAQSNFMIFKDFAHAPSKLKASLKAVRTQFANHKIIACFELHTFSSLNISFLPQYKNAMDEATEAYIYCSEDTLKRKKMDTNIEIKAIQSFFGRDDLQVKYEIGQLWESLKQIDKKQPTILLMMSSGSWSGANLLDLVPC